MTRQTSRLNRFFASKTARVVFAAAVSAAIVVGAASAPPPGNSRQSSVIVPEGATLKQVASILTKAGAVRYGWMYEAYAIFMGGRVKAGHYALAAPEWAPFIAWRLARGIEGQPVIRVTLSEGLTSSDMAKSLARAIPGFDGSAFLALARPQEGYLFPDTYYFYGDTTPGEAAEAMKANFNYRTAALRIQAAASGHSFGDIVKMASIVEDEATSTADRRVIAGILWKRLAMNMPLQVDPPFFYVLGKTSAELTAADLAVDSPYNLYRHTGLPPTPIGNPGLDALEAAMHPTATPYLFYLSGSDGVMHYATDLSGHIANRRKYLN